MRRILRFGPLLLVLAFACTKSTVAPPVRLDFVGASRFTSGTRTVSAADTLLTKLYAQVSDTSPAGPSLQRLQIQLTSSPTRTPVIYPTSLATYKPVADPPLVYLDSVLPAGTKDLAFLNSLSARTTSGVDLWDYTITDTKGATATRAYRLVLRRTDSATAVVHTYRIYTSPVPYRPATPLAASQKRALAYVGLRQGLLLPHFAIAAGRTDNYNLVDVACVATGTDIRLASMASANFNPGRSNQLPATELRSTTLSLTEFSNITTNALLKKAFDDGRTYNSYLGDAYISDPLVKAKVLAFRITDPVDKATKYGILLIADLVRTPTATVTCQVVVQK